MSRIRIIMTTVAALICLAVMAEDNKSIAQREYWFDNDISTLQTLGENTTAVSISGLAQGLHSFTMRVQDSNGVWSSPMTKYFVVKPTLTTTTVAACEYWFDNDVANRNTLGESVATVEMNGLTQGLHSFTMRVKNDAGVWSSPMTKYFVVKPIPSTTTVAACEYWFDNDVANRETLGESVATVEMNGLTQGLHSFTMRVKNDAGVWSSPMTKYFIVPAGAFMENGLTVSRYLYWIDENEVVTGTLSSANDIITVFLSSLEAGEHVLTWMVGDSKGTWSPVYTESFVYDPSMITTNIDDAGADSRKDVYYDLQGRRISKPVKGPYIVNGKIVIK